MRFLLGQGPAPAGLAGQPGTGQPGAQTFGGPTDFGGARMPGNQLNFPQGQPGGIQGFSNDFNSFGGSAPAPGGLGGAVQPFGGQPLNFGGQPGGAQVDPARQRLESFFGPLSSPATQLQRQSAAGIGGALAGQGPETNVLNSLSPGLLNLFNQGTQGGPGGFQGSNAFGGDILSSLNNLAAGGGTSGLGSPSGGFGGNFGSNQLQQIIDRNPGQGILDALQPHFQRNLDEANLQGGRFGSANAILRSRAVDDFNLLGAQAAGQDADRQLQAAIANAQLAQSQGAAGANNQIQQQQLQLEAERLRQAGQFGAANLLLQQAQLGQQGALQQAQLGQQGALGAANQLSQTAGQAGNADFSRLLQGFGVGQQQAQQNDIGTQRQLAILLQQLGAQQQATLGAPVQTTGTGFQQGTNIGSGIGSLLALLGASGKGGAAG